MERLLIPTFIGVFLLTFMVLQSPVASTGASSASSSQTNSPPASPTPTATYHSSGLDTEIRRDSSGHFKLDVAINGQDTSFLIDTGADLVALTVNDAERLGLPVDRSNFQPVGRTASGLGYGMFTRLDRIEVAGHELTNVEAVVMEGLSTNLLGQSALRQLGKVELQGDMMVIRGG